MTDESSETVTKALAGDAESIRAIVDALSPEIEARVARALAGRGASAEGKDRAHELEDVTRDVFAALFEDSGRALREWKPSSGTLLGDFVAPFVEAQLASATTGDAVSRRATDAKVASGANDEALADYEPVLDDMARARIASRLMTPRVPAPPTAMFQVAVRSTRARRVAAILLPLALVIIALLFMLRSRGRAPLPDYTLALSSGDTPAVASAAPTPSAPLVVVVPTLLASPESRISIVLGPTSHVEGAVSAAAFFFIDGGSATTWRAPISIAEDGTARIEGTARDILPTGKNEFDVVVAVGRARALPTEATLASQLETSRPDVKLFRCRIVLASR